MTKVYNQTKKLTLRDVLYVPNAQNNLYSISRLDEAGGTATIGEGKIVLRNNTKQIIAMGKKFNRLYMLDAHILRQPADKINFVQVGPDNTWMAWH
ncbi:hypothetical protein BDN72DRAFT_782280, partial [Pluteus cervinus]